ncbi:uncharacterized protein LOC142142812 isoform X2 [Mixophyes fleayi]
MEHLTKLVETLGKRIGCSSNQLLKCVLLNTAIELFSYIDAPTYSGSVYQYHDWNMEDFDHLYTALPDTGQLLKCPEELVACFPSDGVNEQVDFQQHSPMSENTVRSSGTLETTYLPVKETVSAQSKQEYDKPLKTDVDMSGMYFFSPWNILLEVSFSWNEQAANSTEYFYFCLATDFQDMPDSTMLNYSTIENNVVINTCGVQMEDLIKINDGKTLNFSDEEVFCCSFYNEDEMDPKSIFWDSYDLHVSRSPLYCAHANMFDGWETKAQDITNIDDILLMVEEMAMKEEHGLDNLLYGELYSLCVVTEETDSCYKDTRKHSDTGEQPVSSTPCMKQRSRKGIRSSGTASPIRFFLGKQNILDGNQDQ